MMNVNDVPRGWKIYVLTWAWLGIVVGLFGASLGGVAAIWAVGASVGWLMVGTVREKGWLVPLRYFGMAVLAIVTVAAGIGGLAFVTGRSEGVSLSDDEIRLTVLTLVAVVSLFKMLRQRGPGSQPDFPNEPGQQVDVHRRTCPRCGKLASRLSDGRLVCTLCGYKSDAREVSGAKTWHAARFAWEETSRAWQSRFPVRRHSAT